MKNRVPRKLKKKAKKLKSRNDAFVIARTAMVNAMHLAQMATISSMPSLEPTPLKALRFAEVAINSAKAVQKSMEDIKPWTSFVPNYRSV